MTVHDTTAIRGLLSFLERHADGLQNAALVLGGHLALKRVQYLLDDLSTNRELNRRVKLDLVALHRLLTLQNVGPVDRLETELFARIDPADPMVEEICLLADDLFGHLKDIGGAAGEQVFDFDKAA